ncbi:MAG: DMT family transporter [Dehalococcoidia bacterium]
MAWFLVVVAGMLEVAFAVALKGSHGFTRLWPSVAVCVFGGSSFLLLTLALKDLPVGTAYAVWTGLGAAGTVLVGILFLREPANLLRVGSVVLVLAGIIGLKLQESA